MMFVSKIDHVIFWHKIILMRQEGNFVCLKACNKMLHLDVCPQRKKVSSGKINIFGGHFYSIDWHIQVQIRSWWWFVYSQNMIVPGVCREMMSCCLLLQKCCWIILTSCKKFAGTVRPITLVQTFSLFQSHGSRKSIRAHLTVVRNKVSHLSVGGFDPQRIRRFFVSVENKTQRALSTMRRQRVAAMNIAIANPRQ
jgi:hypothetical protein